jgi:CRP/FNR family cyclic AMP-dependent transcriptional regulator
MATLLDHAQNLLDHHAARGVTARSLAAVFSTARVDRIRDGHAVCTEGEPGDAMFFLMKGAIRVQRRDPKGKMRELATIAAPALFGHMALIDNSPRSATCVAVGESIVATLDRRSYNTVLNEPTSRGTALRRVLLASLTRQLVSANDRIRDLIRPQEVVDDVERVEDFGDVSNTDILKVSGVLDGWKVDADTWAQADTVETVYTEDQLRNPRNKLVK